MFGLFRRKKDVPAESEADTVLVTGADRRVYILDFDRTITILHTGAIAYGNELTPVFIQKNVKKGFADFVRKVTGRGHAVYIASYSDDSNIDLVEGEALSGHDLIKYYMDLVFGPEQTIFTPLRKNEAGEIVAIGNIIANNTQDYKQYHLDIVVQLENLDQDNPADMKRIYLIEDDEDVVRFFMAKGCTTIVPYSASRSADTAATKTLFTSYMPETFTA